MMRYRANMFAPLPPPEMAQCPAYLALPGSTKALLALIDIEIASQGGLLAAMNTDDICAASGLGKRALLAALNELSRAGFIVTSMIGKLCIVALSSAWRRT
jgi:hypothetical protein